MEYKKIIKYNKGLLMSLFYLFILLFQLFEIIAKGNRQERLTKYHKKALRKNRKKAKKALSSKNFSRYRNRSRSKLLRKGKGRNKNRKTGENVPGVYRVKDIAPIIKENPNIVDQINHSKGNFELSIINDQAEQYKQIAEKRIENNRKNALENSEDYILYKEEYIKYSGEDRKEVETLIKNGDLLTILVFKSLIGSYNEPKIATDEEGKKIIELNNKMISDVFQSEDSEKRSKTIQKAIDMNIFQDIVAIDLYKIDPDSFKYIHFWNRGKEKRFFNIIKKYEKIFRNIKHLETENDDLYDLAKKIYNLVLAYLLSNKNIFLPIFDEEGKIIMIMNDLIAAASSSIDDYGILCKIYLELESKVYGKNIKLKSGNIKLETPSSFFKKAMYIAGGAAVAGVGYAGYKAYKSGGDWSTTKEAIGKDLGKIKGAASGAWESLKGKFSSKKKE